MMTIDELVVADEPSTWVAAGFRADDGICQVGAVDVRLAGRSAGVGLVRFSLRGLREGVDLDGLPAEPSSAAERRAAPAHPNGVLSIDHVVAFTPDRARTVARLESGGFTPRRLRDEPTPGGGGSQAFFRLGEVILEVIEYAPGTKHAANREAPAQLWGLAFTVESLDRSAAVLAERLGEPRDAVQRGRRIATARRSAGFSVPVAFMTPVPGAV